MHCVIMFADDDVERVESRITFFDDHGFRALSASTGSLALETAANYRPHVVVLNEDLPEVQGTDVCLRLKQEADTAHAWIIMIGNDTSKEERFVSNEVGVDAYLPKGTSNEELLDKVHELLRTARSSA